MSIKNMQELAKQMQEEAKNTFGEQFVYEVSVRIGNHYEALPHFVEVLNEDESEIVQKVMLDEKIDFRESHAFEDEHTIITKRNTSLFQINTRYKADSEKSIKEQIARLEAKLKGSE